MGLMPAGATNPFTRFDKQSVIGILKASGSHDPDVLHAQKMQLSAPANHLKLLGVISIGFGALLTITIILSWIGIPFLVFGWWVRRFGRRNIETVDAAYAEFVATGMRPVNTVVCFLIAIALGLSAMACGGSSTSPSPASGGAPTPTPTPSGSVGSLTFRMDGTLITSTTVTAAFTNGILTLGGGVSASNITFSLALTPTTAQVGTYTLGPLSATNSLLLVGNPAQGWSAGVGTGSGTVTLTAFSATGATGTFALNLASVPGSGSTGTKVITEGAFNVAFASVPAPAPTTSTSAISASINGVAWTSSLTRRATLGNNLLTLTGQDTNLRVLTLVLPVSGSLLVPPAQAPTISLTFSPSPFGVVSMVLGSQHWDNGFAGGVGSATITSIAATRVTGTFTVTLVNNPVNAVPVQPAALTNGQFDMTLERF
jgi:hypothetical protein